MASRRQRGIGSLLPVLAYLRPYRWRLFGAGFALLFTAAATLSMGRGLQVLIDNGFGGGSDADLAGAIALLVAIAAAMAVGSYFAGSTPMGGGTVGFPVLVLLFDGPATLGRDFASRSQWPSV